jgi:hypothetical protein
VITEKRTESCTVPVPSDIVDNEMTSQELTDNKTVVSPCGGTQDMPRLLGNSKPNDDDDEDKNKPIRIYNLLDIDRGQAVTSLVSSEELFSKTGANLLNKNLTTNDKPVEIQEPEATSKL